MIALALEILNIRVKTELRDITATFQNFLVQESFEVHHVNGLLKYIGIRLVCQKHTFCIILPDDETKKRSNIQ